MNVRLSPFVDVPYTFYVLADPRTDLVRYVGRTFMPMARFAAHRLNRTGLPAKRAWVSGLLAVGLVPRVLTLEVGMYSGITSARRESEWIQHFVEQGRSLLNGEVIGQRRWVDCEPRVVQGE